MPLNHPIVELRYGDAWHDVTLDVFTEETIAIARGRRDWAADADPAQATLRFNNGASKVAPGVEGRYSPRNPLSDLYGLIGRNTPLRIRLGEASSRLVLPGTVQSVVSTPDEAALRLTGDQRFELHVAPAAGWDPATFGGLARRDDFTAGQRAWAWWVLASGQLRLRIWSDASTFRTWTSDAAIAPDAGPMWIAWEFDQDDGAGSAAVAFETAPDAGGAPGAWAALGTPQTQAGTAAMMAAQVPLEVGRTTAPGAEGVGIPAFAFSTVGAAYRDGAGTAVCEPVFTAMDADDTQTTDALGRVWTLGADAFATDPSVRFSGEVASWPQSWNLAGTVKGTTVTAAGVLRRAQQHTAPLASSLRRDLSTRPNVIAYWPMEDADGSPRFASGLPDRPGPLTPTDLDGLQFAADSESFAAAAPLPTFDTAEARGSIAAYTADDDQRFLMLLRLPEAGLPAAARLASLRSDGLIARLEVGALTSGQLQLAAFDRDGALIDTLTGATNWNGRSIMVSVWTSRPTPLNVFKQLSVFEVGAAAGIITENTIGAWTLGRYTSVSVGNPAADLAGTVIGHAALMNGDVHSVWSLIGESLDAWDGENAADRLARLGRDEGIPVRILGQTDTAMGPQRLATVLDLMREVPAADLGAFSDARDAAAIAYRPAATIAGRPPVLTIDYAAGQVSEPFQPTDDDQSTINSVTATNVKGGSAIAEDTTGPLSVNPPPAGVGRYEQAVEVNLSDVDAVDDNASWRLALGTTDAPRWPTVRINLNHPAAAPIRSAALAVELGDVIEVVNLPAWAPPGPARLLVDAVAEEIRPETHYLEWTCEPSNVWSAVGRYDGTGTAAARYDTAGTISAAAVTDSQTTITMTTTEGPLWTTDPADLPFDLTGGGERITVTAIGPATGADQDFTVTRAANGITKPHPAGTSWSLAYPTRYAL